MEQFTSIKKQTVSILIFNKGNVSILNQCVCPIVKKKCLFEQQRR